MAKPNGLLLYDGPSLLDGSPIIVIATGLAGGSKNAKTGNMIQTWILRGDMTPIEAVKQSADDGICGQCPHRGDKAEGRGRTCYVNIAQAPQAVYRKHRGANPYPTYDPTVHAELFTGRRLRIGSYGDPVAVPMDVWQPLVDLSDGWTGYTHQWHTPRARPYRLLLMASVDSDRELWDASCLEWRTFRVRAAHEDIFEGEVICPASEEAGKVTNCASCGLCKGASVGPKVKSVVIIAHGGIPVKANFKRRHPVTPLTIGGQAA